MDLLAFAKTIAERVEAEAARAVLVVREPADGEAL
jgi:hypothetical protein